MTVSQETSRLPVNQPRSYVTIYACVCVCNCGSRASRTFAEIKNYTQLCICVYICSHISRYVYVMVEFQRFSNSFAALLAFEKYFSYIRCPTSALLYIYINMYTDIQTYMQHICSTYVIYAVYKYQRYRFLFKTNPKSLFNLSFELKILNFLTLHFFQATFFKPTFFIPSFFQC